MRKTSITAYKEIRDSGLLSERRWEAYDTLFRHGPATAMELRRFFPKGFVDSQIRARLNELRELGVAYEVKERACSVTGMVVIEWDVTDSLPTPTDKIRDAFFKAKRAKERYVSAVQRYQSLKAGR